MDTTTREPLAEGVFLGGYRIVHRLAEGRFWDVYLARSSSTQRVVALNLLHPGLPEDRVRRFLLKAGDLTGLEHPHVARIFEAGQDGGRTFFAQEYIEGPRGRALSLADELRNHGGCLPEDTVRLRGRQVWEGLRAAHAFRDEGLNWNGAWLGEALLTPQHRVKLLAPGLRDLLAGSEATGPVGVTADVQGFGEFLFMALTGCPSGPQAPSELGVPKAWDKVVGICRSATPQALPPDAVVYDGLMTAGKPSHRGQILIGIAALVVLTAVISAGLVLRARNRPSAEEVARLEQEQANLQLEQQVGKYLTAAEAALARMEFSTARRVVEQVLKEVPDYPKAKALLADIEAAEGLARIGATKNAAEETWARIRDLPSGQGVAARLGEAKVALDAARLALAENRFEVAKTSYEKVIALGNELLQSDVARDDAVRSRSLAATARETASEGNAAEYAAETWQQAATADTGAASAFEQGDFVQAGKLWQTAEKTYAAAGEEAEGCQEANAAKDAFARQILDTKEARVKVAEAVIGQAQELNRQAHAALADRRWQVAAQNWREATALLANAGAAATEAQRQQNYATALAEGQRLLAAKDFAGAQLAFAQALSEPGKGADPEAMKLHEQARLARIDQANNQAYRGPDGNLVFNSGFEKGGKGAPDGWTTPDNLTVFWDDRGAQGKCLRLDTDVYRSEWEEHRQHPDEPMTKTPTSGTKYNTVGGTTGVAVYSRPIPVEPNAYYAVEFDIRGKGEPFIFVKGFWKCGPQDLYKMGKKMFFKPFKPGPSYSLMAMGTSGEEKRDAHPGDYIQCFRRRLVARVDNPNEWRHFKTIMKFEGDRHIEVVLLELYAYWPPGDYFFDNVSLKQVTEKDAAEFDAWRQKLGEDANHGIPAEKAD